MNIAADLARLYTDAERAVDRARRTRTPLDLRLARDAIGHVHSAGLRAARELAAEFYEGPEDHRWVVCIWRRQACSDCRKPIAHGSMVRWIGGSLLCAACVQRVIGAKPERVAEVATAIDAAADSVDREDEQ
jgi:hypothetical protein